MASTDRSATAASSQSPLPSALLELGFKALSDPLRLQILDQLRQQELCVCDLCDRLQVRQSKLSFHLKVLKEGQLLHARQEGKWVYYRLNLLQFAQLEQYLCDFRRAEFQLPTRLCREDESYRT